MFTKPIETTIRELFIAFCNQKKAQGKAINGSEFELLAEFENFIKVKLKDEL